MDIAANLDKIQIIKIVLQPKIGLMKKEKILRDLKSKKNYFGKENL